jgi:hypothetical protein
MEERKLLLMQKKTKEHFLGNPNTESLEEWLLLSSSPSPLNYLPPPKNAAWYSSNIRQLPYSNFAYKFDPSSNGTVPGIII